MNNTDMNVVCEKHGFVGILAATTSYLCNVHLK